MNKLSGTYESLVTIYTGDEVNNVLPAGPCNLLYCTTPQGYLKSALLLSETDGSPAISYVVTDSISETDWLQVGPAKGTLYALEPIKVSAIDVNTGEITCLGDTAQYLIGALPTVTVLYTVDSHNWLSSVVLCDPNEQSIVKLKLIIEDTVTESDWLTLVSSSIKVNSVV